MINVTLRFGLTRSVTTEVSETTTIGDLRANTEIVSILRIPEEVTAVVNGVAVDNHYVLQADDEVQFEIQAAKKA